MKEEWISYIWSNRLYAAGTIYDTNGKALQILNPGFLNTFSGPDFDTAKIRYRDEVLVGRVEIHLKTSDYLKHKHELDPSYDSIIAHVVWEHDLNVDPSSALFLVELKDQCAKGLLAKIKQIQSSKNTLACADYVQEVPSLLRQNMLEKSAVERFESKSTAILDMFKQNDIWICFLDSLVKALGAPVNDLPFTVLLKSFDNRILIRAADNPKKLEALLFGQAGFLDQPVDTYQAELLAQYEILKKLHGLNPIDSAIWKRGGMRLSSFPAVLISWFAAFLTRHSQDLLSWMNFNTTSHMKDYLQVNRSSYWQSHYDFDKPTKKELSGLGSAACNRLLINCFVPFLFAYARFNGSSSLEDRAFNWLGSLPVEANNVVKRYQAYGFELNNALESQGAIGLERNYCKLKKCLNCEIANHRLKQTNEKSKKLS